jgi:hypothetical protein
MLLGFRAVPAAKSTYHNKIDASTARACRARKKKNAVYICLPDIRSIFFSLLKNEIQESILLTKEIKVSQDSNLV